MIFGDAMVARASIEGPASPLLEACAKPVTICELVGTLGSDRRSEPGPKGEEALVLELLELEAAGAVRVSPVAHGQRLRDYYRSGAANGDRSLAYVATYERNWTRQRALYDFVQAGDANAARKAFQRDLYLRHLDPMLARLAPGASVLDAGCGVGRLTAELLDRNLRVTCADASAEALKCAVRVGLQAGASSDALDARLCDVRDLSCFGDGVFDATVALELICYQEDPSVGLRELVRVTAPGGAIALSVEGLHGSLIADPKLAGDASQGGQGARALNVLDTATLDIDDEISVRYFTKDSLRTLLESSGLEDVAVVGTHYTADGVLDHLVTDEALADAASLRQLVAVERAAAADPKLEPLARSWFATARVAGDSR